MTVPYNWQPVSGSDKTGKELLSVGRIYVRYFEQPSSVDIKESPYTSEPWTLDDAKQWQADFIESIKTDAGHRPAVAISKGSQKYTAACVQSSINAKQATLHCALLGTKLQFDFIGDPAVFPEVNAMISSLH